MRRTLYAKLALSLTALVAALLVAQVWITMRVSRFYEEEASQRLYRDLAANLLSERIDPRWGLPVIEGAFETLMRLNPFVELYWIDPEGRLLAYSAPEGRVVRDRVDVAPIRAFLDEREPLPIRGDDPRSAERRVIFSAAEVRPGGELEGYLYAVLQGESYQSLASMLKSSETIQLAVGSAALVSVFGLVVGLVLFRSITRRVTELDRDMARFLAGPSSGAERIRLRGADELDRLRATFDHLAERVSEQVRALEEVDRARRELEAGVSHDLRTPLSALRGYLETLQVMGATLPTEEQRRYLDAASRHTERLASLVESLAELAKLESGVVQLQREHFQVEELVQDVVQTFALRARDAGVELRCEGDAGLPPVYADLRLVERVLENLVDNALRHTPSGGAVAVAVREVGGETEVSVTDSGPGIPAGALPRVFERFYRGEGAGSGGFGLGLAIVQRIVALHGRGVEVDSAPGRGTRFAFRLGGG